MTYFHFTLTFQVIFKVTWNSYRHFANFAGKYKKERNDFLQLTETTVTYLLVCILLIIVIT